MRTTGGGAESQNAWEIGEYNTRETAVQAINALASIILESEPTGPLYAIRLSEIFYDGDEVIGQRNVYPLSSEGFNGDSEADRRIVPKSLGGQAINQEEANITKEQTESAPITTLGKQLIKVTDEKGRTIIIRTADIKAVIPNPTFTPGKAIIVTDDGGYNVTGSPDDIYALIYEED